MRTGKPDGRIRTQIDGAIGWLIFDNPARRNAISLGMWGEIPAAFDLLEDDPAVRAIVLCGGDDKAFTAGADIVEFETVRASAEQAAHYNTIAEEALRRLQTCPKPTIAMVRGYCMSVGLGVALSCDLRIAGDSARFANLAAKLSLSYRWTDTKRLVDTVGVSRAKDMFFTARHVPANEALDYGLIDYLCPDGELDTFTRDYCARIAENAPLTMAATKEIIAEVTKPSSEIDREKCKAAVAHCYASEDYVEGRRAFVEKRKPVFRGR